MALSKPSRPASTAPVVSMYSSTRPGRLVMPAIQSIEWPGPATKPSSEIRKWRSTLPDAVCGSMSVRVASSSARPGDVDGQAVRGGGRLDELELERRGEILEQREPRAERRRLDHEPVLVDQPEPGERLVEPGAAVGDQVVPRLALEAHDLLGEVAACDPRLGPVGTLQRLREDDLRDLVHRPRELARRRRPGRGHLLVRDPAHQVGASAPHRVEDPLLDGLAPAPVVPRVRPVESRHVSVDRDARLKDEPAHVSPGTRPYGRSRPRAAWAPASAPPGS